MSENKMKLIYFNARGMAEFVRLIFAEAAVEYEDVRLSRDEWIKIKSSTPFEQLPALECNGQTISQSRAIARFVAREYNLAGKSNWEAAKADMIVDSVADLIPKFLPIVREQDAEKKKEKVDAFISDNLTPFMTNVQGILEKNGGEYLVGNELTYADIGVANILSALSTWIGEDWMEKNPKVKDFKNKILERPNIKKWIETRPVTEQ